MPGFLYFATAIVIAFWVRWVARHLLRGLVRSAWLPWLSNGASAAACISIASLIRTSNLEAVNLGVIPIYAAAQLVWLALDLFMFRNRKATA